MGSSSFVNVFETKAGKHIFGQIHLSREGAWSGAQQAVTVSDMRYVYLLRITKQKGALRIG